MQRYKTKPPVFSGGLITMAVTARKGPDEMRATKLVLPAPSSKT